MPFFQKPKKKNENSNPMQNIVHSDAIKEFCQLILCDTHQEVVEQCVSLMESGQIDLETLLYILSGYDDIYSKNGEKLFEKPLVAEEFYLISSDCGAPDMDTFFWFIDGLKKYHELEFTYDKSKFSQDRAMDCWMGELVGQLEDLYILVFGANSDTYHYLITNKNTGNRLKILYDTLGTEVYETADFIDSDFCE